SRGLRWCRFRPPARPPRHWDCCTRSAWRRVSARPEERVSAPPGRRRWARQLAQRSRPHYPEPSRPSREPGPRWGLPWPLALARPPAPEWRLFVRKWRQTPPHTAQSPAWTLSLPDACPTSNPFRSVPLIRHLPNFGPYPLIQP